MREGRELRDGRGSINFYSTCIGYVMGEGKGGEGRDAEIVPKIERLREIERQRNRDKSTETETEIERQRRIDRDRKTNT